MKFCVSYLIIGLISLSFNLKLYSQEIDLEKQYSGVKQIIEKKYVYKEDQFGFLVKDYLSRTVIYNYNEKGKLLKYVDYDELKSVVFKSLEIEYYPNGQVRVRVNKVMDDENKSVFLYDDKKRKINRKYYHNGKIISFTQYMYDDDDRLILTKIFNNNHILTSEEKWEYNEKLKKKTKTKIYSNGRRKVETSLYNHENDKIYSKKEYYNNDGSVKRTSIHKHDYQYVYDNTDRVIEKRKYEKGVLVYKKELTYHVQNIVNEIVTFCDPKYPFKTCQNHWRYDQHDNLTKHLIIEDGELKYKNDKTYTFNSKGNWIKCIDKSTGIPVWGYIREYCYF